MGRDSGDNEIEMSESEDPKRRGGNKLDFRSVDGDHWVFDASKKNTKTTVEAKKTTKTRRWAEAMIRATGRKTAEAKKQAVATISAAMLQKENQNRERTEEKDTNFSVPQKHYINAVM